MMLCSAYRSAGTPNRRCASFRSTKGGSRVLKCQSRSSVSRSRWISTALEPPNFWTMGERAAAGSRSYEVGWPGKNVASLNPDCGSVGSAQSIDPRRITPSSRAASIGSKSFASKTMFSVRPQNTRLSREGDLKGGDHGGRRRMREASIHLLSLSLAPNTEALTWVYPASHGSTSFLNFRRLSCILLHLYDAVPPKQLLKK